MHDLVIYNTADHPPLPLPVTRIAAIHPRLAERKSSVAPKSPGGLMSHATRQRAIIPPRLLTTHRTIV